MDFTTKKTTTINYCQRVIIKNRGGRENTDPDVQKPHQIIFLLAPIT
jgi:hypothetical protein